jgi:hypothetical protein
MGRVSRYKKVKAFDRIKGGGEYVWGTSSLLDRKPRKKSLTAQKHEKVKMNVRNKRKKDQASGNTLLNQQQQQEPKGSYDLPPSGKDDFDLNDLEGSVMKEKKRKLDDGLISTNITSTSTARINNVKNSDETLMDDFINDDGEHGEKMKPKAKISCSQVNIGSDTLNCSIPRTEKEERQLATFIKSTQSSEKADGKKTKLFEKKKEGESMRAFNKRLKEETHLALAQDFKDSRTKKKSTTTINHDGTFTEETLSKSERRKEYLKQKKLKKKKKNMPNGYNHDDDDDDDDELVRGSTQNQPFKYKNSREQQQIPPPARSNLVVEQVEQPPIFKLLPRGAENKSNLKMKGKNSTTTTKTTTSMNNEMIQAEQNAMEVIRQKVQKQYALMKAKRRKDGDFHL